MELKNVDCVICRGSRFVPYADCLIDSKDCELSAGKSFSLARCADCGMVSVNPQPVFSLEELGKIYSSGYYRSYGLGAGESLDYRLGLIAKHQDPGSVLEIGCGEAELLKSLQERGWKVAGVDVSACACSAAAAKGVPVFQGSLEQADFPESSFDAVVCADVLEHVPDPAGLLRRAHRLLKPGGIIHISVPNISGLHYRIMSVICRFNHKNYFLLPYHLHHFNPVTLEKLCHACGFKLITAGRAQSRFPGKGIKAGLVRLLYGAGELLGQTDRITAVAVRER